MTKKKGETVARRAKGSVPPRLDLGASVELITEFYERAGGNGTPDELSAIMQNSRKSSAYQLKMTALRSFDLILTENERVSLSSLAESIVAPQDADHRAAALKEAFLRVDLFGNVYEKFVGKLLPQDEFLKNSFLDSGRELADQWMRKFKASAHAAGLLMDRGDGKLQVLGKASRLQMAREPDDAVEVIETSAPSARTLATPPARTEYQMLIEILNAEMTVEEQAAVWTLIQYLKKRDAGVTDKMLKTQLAESESHE